MYAPACARAAATARTPKGEEWAALANGWHVVFEPVPTGQAGGRLVLAYHNANTGDRRQLHLPTAKFGYNLRSDYEDYLYLYDPDFPTASEIGLRDTFNNFANHWRQYYTAAWSLSWTQVWFNSGGTLTLEPVLPPSTPVVGTADLVTSELVATTRTFTVYSERGKYFRLRLGQVLANIAGVTRPLSTIDGGFDARDRALIAYLSSPDCRLRASDGYNFRSLGSVRSWWAKQVEPGAGGEGDGGTGGGSGGGTTGLSGNCINFPMGATICNDADNVIHITTPDGHFALDTTGITLPGGVRLEVIGP